LAWRSTPTPFDGYPFESDAEGRKTGSGTVGDCRLVLPSPTILSNTMRADADADLTGMRQGAAANEKPAQVFAGTDTP
jgi:hypothetical protein